MLRVLIPLLIALLSLPCRSQDVSFLQHIRQDSCPDLHIALNWRTLEKQKKEKAYHTCQTKILIQGRDTLHLPARIKTRGNMRLSICAYPPLKLKFDKADLARCHLSDLNEMDIVHPCHDGETYDQFLLREYMAYKIWEIVSPYHFKTQLVRLHYHNEDGSAAHESSYAILVENAEEVADRLGARRNKTPVISHNAIDRLPMLHVALFQFMIGNTDWHITSRHNLEFFGVPGHSLLVTVPYDFDYSGLVSAPYAAPHLSLDLPSVSIRYYQGWCYEEEEVARVLQVYHDNKERILALPSMIPGLDERSVKHTTDYLNDFYDIIENPHKLKHQIIRHCDMWPVKK